MSRARGRRAVAVGAWITLALGLGAAGVIAGRAFTAGDGEAATSEVEPVLYTVGEGEVGHAMRFEARASWPMSTLVWASNSGVVTSIDLPEDGMVEVGARLLTIALRPVIVLPGQTPASRDLMLGMSGPDVQQLQEYLIERGLLASGDGTFRDATRRAVIAWQREAGFAPADGMVRFGDVAFIPELPARVILTEGIAVGTSVSTGQPIVEGAVGPVSVEIEAHPEQAAMIPELHSLDANIDGFSWPGRLGVSQFDPQTSVMRIPVESPTGGLVCGTDCAAALPLGVTTVVALDAVVIPQTVGALVPVSAISTDPTGNPAITLASGETLAITIVAAHGGLAVVDGVEVGTSILVFGD